MIRQGALFLLAFLAMFGLLAHCECGAAEIGLLAQWDAVVLDANKQPLVIPPEYIVRYWVDNGETKEAVTARTQYRLALDLQPGQLVHFKIAARNEAGTSGWSQQTIWLMPSAAVVPIPPDQVRIKIELPGMLRLEAEEADLSQHKGGRFWKRSNIPAGFSGLGVAQAVPIGGGILTAGAGPQLDYKVQFDKAGVYYVWLRAWAKNGAENSVWLGADGDTQNAVAVRTETFGKYLWTNLRQESDQKPAALKINTPGAHTLHLWSRESGMLVDVILLTPDPAYRPQ